jgi:hypothetical protein
MAPVQRRRRLPTLVNRGLGLLEVILPRGHGGEGWDTILPAGRRDASGFWYPETCRVPGDLFTAEQRRLQARQREVQQRRRRTRIAAGASPAAPGTPPERPVPLPAPISETGGSRPARTGVPRSAPRDQLLPPPADPLGRAAARAPLPLVVDSRRGSE